MNRFWVLGLACVFSAAVCAQTQVGDAEFPEGTVQLAVHASEIEWQPCPPGLPEGCGMAVLEGNPQGPGLFTVRFRIGDNFALPPHWHPRDERVTVLEGSMSVAFGELASREDAKQFGPGDYYVNARNAVHIVWANKPSIIQITGIGPWEVHRVEQNGQ